MHCLVGPRDFLSSSLFSFIVGLSGFAGQADIDVSHFAMDLVLIKCPYIFNIYHSVGLYA